MTALERIGSWSCKQLADFAQGLPEKPELEQRIHGAPSVKIGLFGNFGSGNFGNDGSLEAMINFLRSAKPDAELVCICECPAKVQELFDIQAIPIRSETRRFRFGDRIPLARTALNLLHTIVTARKFDILVAPGTGLLDDFSDSPWGMPTILASWCAGARLAGAKIAFTNIGAGPIVHPLSRRLMKAAARMAHYRSYRDFEFEGIPSEHRLGYTAGPRISRLGIWPAFSACSNGALGARHAGHSRRRCHEILRMAWRQGTRSRYL